MLGNPVLKGSRITVGPIYRELCCSNQTFMASETDLETTVLSHKTVLAIFKKSRKLI